MRIDYPLGFGHSGDCAEGCDCDMTPAGQQRRRDWEANHESSTYFRAEDVRKIEQTVRDLEAKNKALDSAVTRLVEELCAVEGELACERARTDYYISIVREMLNGQEKV